MGITRRHNGQDVTGGSLVVQEWNTGPIEIAVTPRIGVGQCVDWPLRFVVRGSAYLSRPAA